MGFDALARLPVKDWAADNCVLLMWATDPNMPQAFELIKAWGFEYKTVGFYWVKLNKRVRHPGDFFMGGGYWTRANPEQCLLAVRGEPQRKSKGVRRLISAPVREHSRKPDEVRTRIEKLVDGPYLEMFARERFPGWHAWGNEVGKFNRDFELV